MQQRRADSDRCGPSGEASGAKGPSGGRGAGQEAAEGEGEAEAEAMGYADRWAWRNPLEKSHAY